MTYTLFETIEDLLYHLRNGYMIVEAQHDLSGQNIVHITILGKPISQIAYRKATLEGEKDSMIAVSNSDLYVINQIERRLEFLKRISHSRNVKDINVNSLTVSFMYKDKYFIELLPRSINDLKIKNLETSEVKFATLSHYSEVFEILEENIKNF